MDTNLIKLKRIKAVIHDHSITYDQEQTKATFKISHDFSQEIKTLDYEITLISFADQEILTLDCQYVFSFDVLDNEETLQKLVHSLQERIEGLIANILLESYQLENKVT